MNFLFVFIGSILIKNYCYNNFVFIQFHSNHSEANEWNGTEFKQRMKLFVELSGVIHREWMGNGL